MTYFISHSAFVATPLWQLPLRRIVGDICGPTYCIACVGMWGLGMLLLHSFVCVPCDGLCDAHVQPMWPVRTMSPLRLCLRGGLCIFPALHAWHRWLVCVLSNQPARLFAWTD